MGSTRDWHTSDRAVTRPSYYLYEKKIEDR